MAFGNPLDVVLSKKHPFFFCASAVSFWVAVAIKQIACRTCGFFRRRAMVNDPNLTEAS